MHRTSINRCIVVVLISLSATLSPCQSPSLENHARAVQLRDQAIAEYRANNFIAARQKVEAAIAADPQFADAYVLLGNILDDSGQSAVALEKYEQAKKLDPDDPAVYNDMGNALSHLGRAKEAEQAWRTALTKDPKYMLANRGLQRLYYEQGRQAELNDLLTAWIKADPGNSEPREALAALKFQMQDPQGAAAVMLEAAEQPTASPDLIMSTVVALSAFDSQNATRLLERLPKSSAQYHYAAGTIRGNQNDTEGAAKEFRAALKIDPEFALAEMALARDLWNGGKREEAIVQYSGALQHSNRVSETEISNIYYSRGTVLMELGRLKEAAEDFERCLKLFPGDARALLNYGLTEIDLGELDRAEWLLQRALVAQPGYLKAHYFLGVIALSKKQPEQAIEHFSLVVNDRAAKATDWEMYSHALNGAGKKEDALAALRKAAEMSKYEDAAILENLANTLDDTGRAEEARKIYERALQLSPWAGLLHYNYGVFLVNNGAVPSGIKEFKEAIRLGIADPNVMHYRTMAHYFLKAEDYENCQKAGRRAIKLDDSDADSKLMLGICLFAGVDQDEGQKLIDAGMKLSPDSKYVPQARAVMTKGSK